MYIYPTPPYASEVVLEHMSSEPILHGIMACFYEPYTSTMNKSNGAQMLWDEIISVDDWTRYRVAQGNALGIIKKDIVARLGQMLKLREDICRDEIGDDELAELMAMKEDYEDSIAKWLVGDVGTYTW